jgi:polyhydroxybutyrate depolymerase
MSHKIYAFLLFLGFSVGIQAQDNLFVELEHDGEDRSYWLYIPSSYDAEASPAPLVFNFHGFSSNAFQQRGYSDMNRVAEEKGFIVCYPNGIGSAWNVNWAFGSTADDIGFTSVMIDRLLSEYNIAPGKVYACGMSNGGFFSYWLACNLADRIAAVASVTGSFSPAMLEDCNPSRQVPIMEVHGTADPIVPYNGLFGTAVPVDEVIDFWIDHNMCDTDFEAIEVPDINPDDGSTVSIEYYQNCENDTEILLARVIDGGHTWPLSPVILPNTNLDYDASLEIWNFFERHEIDGISSTDLTVVEKQLHIFPNPANQHIHINQPINSYQFSNTHGQKLMSGIEPIIDISNLSSGLYIISVEVDGRTLSSKFIKN